MTARVIEYLDTNIANLSALKNKAADILAAGDMLVASLRDGGKIIFCGNGGSAADSQHLAAEMMGRFLRERDPLPALALTVDTSAVTAIGNDYGFDQVFSRQLRGIGRRGDILVGISTSGNSSNVVAAIQAARQMGIRTLGLTGATGGRMASLCDLCLRAPSSQTNHIQEICIVIGHILCGFVEDNMPMA